MTSAWNPGDTTLTASGTVRAVERFFGVDEEIFVAPDGTRFHAPAQPPRIPAAIATEVTAAVGFDNRPLPQLPSLPAATGLSPADAASFYDIAPLWKAGFDGRGITVVIPEFDEFDPNALNAYAAKFHLSPFDVQVMRNPSAWGNPGPEEGEADLDVELIHGIAPGAKEIVYYGGDGYGVFKAVIQALEDHPGAVVSWSIDFCEALDQGQQQSKLLAPAEQKAAAMGTTIMVASSDKGAYDCIFDGDQLPDTLSVNLFASIPSVTAVGGTLVEPSSTGGYGREVAWGEPLEQWGSGGGLSTIYPRPSWQRGPGVQNQYSNGMRQVPDVSSNADSLSGWDVFTKGMDAPVGGTSSGAPFWAGVAAVIDQYLAQRHVQLIGFANPTLYALAQLPSGIPAPPFHDVTSGTNLYYDAGPGWDYATGLGTPDVAALTDDLYWYFTQKGSGGSS